MHRQYKLHKRQSGTSTDPLAVPSADGLDGNGSTAGGSSTGTVLAFNTDVGSLPSASAPPLAGSGTSLVVTVSQPPTATSTSTFQAPSDAVSDSSKSSSQFSIGMVVGICCGAFAIAGLLICFSVYFYKSSARRTAASGRTTPRPKPKSEIWDRLGDDQDHWEGKPQMKQSRGQGLKKSPSTTLKKTPSLSVLAREYSSPRTITPDMSPAPFSAYHPNLAAELAEPPKAFVQGGSGWNASAAVTSQGDTFVSLRSVHIETGTMSPTLNPAKMTPPATEFNDHRWESAEVVLPDNYFADQEPTNPFVDTPEEPVRRKSESNPFFGAQDAQRRSVVRKNTLPTNPFTDESSIPRISHGQSDSTASDVEGSDRAMQSLISALNLPQSEVERRLKFASMQSVGASELSRYSVMTGESSVYGRESMLFPTPPEAK